MAEESQPQEQPELVPLSELKDRAWRAACRMAERWGGFWEFGDDSADEEAFMVDLQYLMSLAAAKPASTPVQEVDRGA